MIFKMSHRIITRYFFTMKNRGSNSKTAFFLPVMKYNEVRNSYVLFKRLVFIVGKFSVNFQHDNL